MQAMRPRLTAAQQLFHLRRSPIAVGDGYAHLGRLLWRLGIRPSPLSREYQVALTLLPGALPKVVVEGPDLRSLAGGRRLPHVYNETPVELCLFQPKYREWAGSMRLDQTVVPWTHLWLFYFEAWLVSDDWRGGGEHPQRLRPRQHPARSST